MDDEEYEIDILGDSGDFVLENLLTRRDRTQASYSLSSNDNYSLPSSDWILENSSPLFNVKSVLTSDQVIYDVPPLFPSTESLESNPNIWTDKERTLLDRGLELFGKSHVRLSQYIGSKNPSQVKSYLRTYPSASLASASSTNSLNTLDDIMSELDTVEVVVSSVDIPEAPSAPPSPAPSPSFSFSSLSDDSLDSDSYMGSTTSSASESEKPIETLKKPPQQPKIKKHFVKKKPKPPPPPDYEDSDDDLDYDNTNIIFKARKLSKYHLMVRSGDQVLPSGEQVIRIKKEENKSDTDVDVLDSDDTESSTIRSQHLCPVKHKIDVALFNPSRGVKISGLATCKRAILPKEKKCPAPVEDENEDTDVDILDDSENITVSETFGGRIPGIANSRLSFLPISDEDSNTQGESKRSSSTKNTKMRKKLKSDTGQSSSYLNRNSNTKPTVNKSVYLNKSNTNVNKNVYLNKPNKNSPPKCIISDENLTIPECNNNIEDLRPKIKKKIVFKEADFRTERNKSMHIDDLLANYDFSNVRLLDQHTQNQRISKLGHISTTKEDRGNKYISVEEIDYHRDFFLHNDPFFVNRFLRIRNYILREWSCKKPKYINRTAIRSGLKHCGSAVLVARIHYYLEQRGLINT